MLTRLAFGIAAMSLVAAVALAFVLHATCQDLALSRAMSTALQAERDQALGALVRQNQAVARLEVEGKAQAQRVEAQQQQASRRAVEAQREADRLLVAPVPEPAGEALDWGADQAARLASRWNGARR